MPAYVKRLPVEFNSTYVKATSYYSSSYYPWFPFNPALTTINDSSYSAWLSSTATVPQRINIDTGVSFILNKIYLENYMTSGSGQTSGVKTFRIYGTNSATAFNNTDGYDLTDLNLLGEFAAAQHAATNAEDPQYFYIVGNSTEYRYVCIIFIDMHSGVTNFIGLRRLIYYSAHDVLDTITSDERIIVRAYVENKVLRAECRDSFIRAFDVWKRGTLNSTIRKDSFITHIYDMPPVSFLTKFSKQCRRSTLYNNGTLYTDTSGYLSGTVTVSGVVWPNVVVRLYYNIDGALINTTLTDDNGNFTFNFLEYKKSYYTVIAFKDGFNAIVYDNVTANGPTPIVVPIPPRPAQAFYWTPLLISNEMWLTTKDTTTIETSLAGVSRWKDKSTNNRHAIQDTQTRQPSVTADGILFDESDESLRISNHYTSTQSIFIVLKCLDTNFVLFGGANQANFGITGTSGETSYPISGNMNNPSIRRDGVLETWTTRNQVYLGLYNRFSILQLENAALSSWTALDLFFYDNAYPDYSTQGIIKEIVVLNSTTATNYNRVLIEGYLAWAHDLQANLPSTHPFKNTGPLNCTSMYPLAFNSTTVKSTTMFNSNYAPEYAINPASSLVDGMVANAFLSDSVSVPQKLNIDYSAAFIPMSVYIENIHNNGSLTYNGVKNLSIYGTNSYTAFTNTTGSDTTNLTLLSNIVVQKHISANVSDPQFFYFENTVAFRYIVCIITGLYEPDGWFGIKRLTIQKLT